MKKISPLKALINVSLVGAFLFVFPIVLMVFLIRKTIALLSPITVDLVHALEINTLFGAATLTIVTLLLIFAVCFISGKLIEAGIIKQWSRSFEEKLMLFVPAYQTLKFRLLDDHYVQQHYKAIILREDQHYRIAFITDEQQDFLSVYIPDAPRMESGEVRLLRRGDAQFTPITQKAAITALMRFGRGMELSQLQGVAS
jgi:uncharacterized membrane protein